MSPTHHAHSRLLKPVLCAALACIVASNALPFDASSGVTELTPETFDSFLKTDKPVLIMFYAPWCGHCKTFHPVFSQAAQQEGKRAAFGAIDASNHRDIATRFGVRGFPTVKLWNAGSQHTDANARDYTGNRTVEAISDAITKAIDGNSQ